MSSTRNLLAAIVIILLTSAHTRAQDPYYPPPADLIYHNDTLTILPPDSLPGDPVVLAGYNLYANNEFLANVDVSDASDPVNYTIDDSMLDPGDYVFCAKAVYNLWISDAVCDTAKLMYGFDLPYFEDWASGTFEDNRWIPASTNWTVSQDEGNPSPAAVFSGFPVQQDYEIPLESYAFRADSMHVGRCWLTFDLKLDAADSSGLEKLFVQSWNWSSKEWQSMDIYSNQSGSFTWSHKLIRIISNSNNGLIFKIRFLASGSNSMSLGSWAIDNINIYRDCMGVTDATVYEYYDHDELYWSPPTGCWDQWIHWDNGINSGNSIGTGGTVEFDVAARWTPEQLHDYFGYPVSKIRFFPAETQAEYSIRIWSADSVVELVYEQAVPEPQIDEWNEIILSSPFYFDTLRELYIGYHVSATSGYPAGVDGGPAIDGYGNMMYYDSTWSTLLEINPDLDYNWNIGALLGSEAEQPIKGFNIYKKVLDGEYQFLEFTTEIPYEDYNIELSETYCYLVTMISARAGDTCESAPSNEACETHYLNIPEQQNDIQIYPNPAKDKLNIFTDENMVRIRLHNMVGEQVMEKQINSSICSIDITSLPDGVYILVVETQYRRVVKRIMVMK